MNEIIKMHPDERVKIVEIKNEMEKSFLDYSMSVIVSRALPDVRDGLKPVHRRILYTLFKKGLTNDKPYRKCADIVGSTLGEFHPHGEGSVYDALVRLAQDFSMRYMLVDGHGNFGSIDDDPAAAQRYTEAKLARISGEMLRDINKDTVDWRSNYDDRLLEPVILPSRFPNLLVNGSTGIAVGMATNIPPHNLRDVIDAVLALINDPDIEIDSLMSVVKGPDFPTGGIIMGHSGMRSAYYTGRGKIILRGRAEISEEKNDTRIVITEVPFMVNKAKMVAAIDQLAKEKRIDGISVVRDESDRRGLKVVVELKRDANANVVLNKLYSYTQLQDTIGIIMLALVNGEPKILNLKEMLSYYLTHQEDVITRRTRHDFDKAKARANILQGLVLASDHVDEVISILRESRNIPEGKERLIERFKDVDMSKLISRAIEAHPEIEFERAVGLNGEQADAIIAMRFGQLTGLEREKLIEELSDIMDRIAEYMVILTDRTKVLEIISNDLKEIRQRYGDERRTS
ncbi:MAG: DNA gyrase subunit A, partial [Eubacterium sp.]|nr:DNA gyrase subunit A [Eubacterium sp.]